MQNQQSTNGLEKLFVSYSSKETGVEGNMESMCFVDLVQVIGHLTK